MCLGVNITASISYTYYAGYGWFDGAVSADDTVIQPTQCVVIRNQSGQPFNFTINGSVPVNQHYALLSTLAAHQDQDNFFGFLSPVPTNIGSSGLGVDDMDLLLAFDNTAAGFNKLQSRVLTYRSGTGWQDENGKPVNTTFQLQPASGYIFRKAGTTAPQSYIWQVPQPYLPLAP